MRTAKAKARCALVQSCQRLSCSQSVNYDSYTYRMDWALTYRIPRGKFPRDEVVLCGLLRANQE